MKVLMNCLLILMYSSAVHSQSISIVFTKDADTIQRSASEVIHPVTIKVEENKIPEKDRSTYLLKVEIDETTSTLPRSAYSIDFNTVTIDKLSNEYTFYIRIKKDEETDRERNIDLNIEIYDKDGKKVSINSAKNITKYSLMVDAFRRLHTTNYLAYVGTNFDLVDGVQAKNLFFATSIFSAPIKKRGIGFSLTLYGNRTTTTTDTSGRVSYQSRAVPIGGDSARFYTEEALKTSSRVSDNLGASFSPVIGLGKISSPDNIVQLYYAPQLEFIWRRTTIVTRYTDAKVVDSLDRAERPFSRPISLTEPVTKTPINIYDIYLGLIGMMLVHENNFISVRIQTALGWNVSYTAGRGNGLTRGEELKSSYRRSDQGYFFARAWITEPKSGVTIGAEVSNTMFNGSNAQPYYNVTLSKAINLSSLGGIFQPVTTRN